MRNCSMRVVCIVIPLHLTLLGPLMKLPAMRLHWLVLVVQNYSIALV